MKLGFGGGCHWCTEATFQRIPFVRNVKQGWIESSEYSGESEAITLTFEGTNQELLILMNIHLHTHSCTSNHSKRKKYRSAFYTCNLDEKLRLENLLPKFQHYFQKPIITEILTLKSFRLNEEKYLDYYKKNPKSGFCTRFILPKFDVVDEILNSI